MRYAVIDPVRPVAKRRGARLLLVLVLALPALALMGVGAPVAGATTSDPGASARGGAETHARSVTATQPRSAAKPHLTRLAPASGKRGATVTITGSGFGKSRGKSSVRFGAAACTKYISWTATRIKCKVPAKAALGKAGVVVKTRRGASNALRFTVTGTVPAPVDPALIGSWAENSTVGWYLVYTFSADGTFLYRISNGSTTSTTRGSYATTAGSIRFFDQIVDGEPAAEETATYVLLDGGATLLIDGVWYFHRI